MLRVNLVLLLIHYIIDISLKAKTFFLLRKKKQHKDFTFLAEILQQLNILWMKSEFSVIFNNKYKCAYALVDNMSN